MASIPVLPYDLRQVAEQFGFSAKRVNVALQAIDRDIHVIKGDQFLGHHAYALQVHYTAKRYALLSAKDLVAYFAEDLMDAAMAFEKTDPVWLEAIIPDFGDSLGLTFSDGDPILVSQDCLAWNQKYVWAGSSLPESHAVKFLL